MSDETDRRREEGEAVFHLGCAGLAFAEIALLVAVCLLPWPSPLRLALVAVALAFILLLAAGLLYHLAAARRHRDAGRGRP